MDTAAKWAVVVAAVAAGTWYYNSPGKKGQKPVHVQEVKKESKKAARKVQNVAQNHTDRAVNSVASAATAKSTDNQDSTVETGASKKRKVNTQAASQTTAALVSGRDDDDDNDNTIDQSTRQFAERMRQARQGVDVKKTDRGDTRVKTVKPKGTHTSSPVLSSGSSQAEDDQWSPAPGPSTLKSSGIADMLEKDAPGPNSLRITAPTQPIKERVNKPKKEEVVETKKQRQNRKKREERQAADAEAQTAQKRLEEQQRRTARIARGEPAKNGVPIAAAPVDNPWSESNARAEAQVATSSNQKQLLLDTFDVESNSSSNAGEMNSTAATSTTDQAPLNTNAEDGEFQKIIEESNLEDGWTDVKTSKKARKQQVNGDVTPTQAAAVPSQTSKKNAKVNGRSSGFGALQDDAE